ncbi:hypothetical protein A2U01_0105249, partial [Trifolium medium]|nr:hypothetical protein [Trifolium medium]
MDESKYLDRDRVPLSSIEAEIDLQVSNMRKGGMDMNMSKK